MRRPELQAHSRLSEEGTKNSLPQQPCHLADQEEILSASNRLTPQCRLLGPLSRKTPSAGSLVCHWDPSGRPGARRREPSLYGLDSPDGPLPALHPPDPRPLPAKRVPFSGPRPFSTHNSVYRWKKVLPTMMVSHDPRLPEPGTTSSLGTPYL